MHTATAAETHSASREFVRKHTGRPATCYGEGIQLRRCDGSSSSDAGRNFIAAMLRDENSSSGGYFPFSPFRLILQTSIRPGATIPPWEILLLVLFTYWRRRRTLLLSHRYSCCITEFGWQCYEFQDSSRDVLCEFLYRKTLLFFHTGVKTQYHTQRDKTAKETG
jgi:hypothetical protein